jgi:Transcriptional regulator, AbiEi antitoxin
LSDVAAGQWGLITSAHARRAGLSPSAVVRLAEGGYLERVRHGVYRIIGTPPSSSDRLRTAWLAIEPGLTRSERLGSKTVEVVSYRSAAQLHRIGDLDSDHHEFTSPVRRQARARDVHFHRGVVPVADRTVVEGLPVTTAMRTLADLARARLDGGHLAGAVRDAVVTLHLDPDRVAEALRPFAHHYGMPVGAGRALVSDLLQIAGIPRSAWVVAQLAIPTDGRPDWEAAGPHPEIRREPVRAATGQG